MNPKQIAEEAWNQICDLTSRGNGKTADFIAIIKAAIEKATEPEFYDQQKWIAQHNIADEHIYDSVGRVIAKAVYYSPAYRESRAAHASERKEGDHSCVSTTGIQTKNEIQQETSSGNAAPTFKPEGAAHASFASTGKTAPLFKPAHASERDKDEIGRRAQEAWCDLSLAKLVRDNNTQRGIEIIFHYMEKLICTDERVRYISTSHPAFRVSQTKEGK